jgi:pimeloyl-ACP methyl ester carboxylesterase
MHVEILHKLTQCLRSGTIPTISQAYNTVILASHSYGSTLGRSLATLYPTTGADAYILTATSPDVVKGFTDALITFHVLPASQVNPLVYSSLPQAYVSISPPAIRTSLYSLLGDFSFGLLSNDETLPHILPAGEVSAGAPLESSPSNFTGPVFVLTGKYDEICCGVGNITANATECSLSDITAMKEFFPKAREFGVYVPDQTGHNINLHYSAGESFGVVNQWLQDVGF